MKKFLVPLLCALPFVGIALWFTPLKNIGNLLTLGFILACPLLHLFVGHGRHNHPHHQKTEKSPKPA